MQSDSIRAKVFLCNETSCFIYYAIFRGLHIQDSQSSSNYDLDNGVTMNPKRRFLAFIFTCLCISCVFV